MYFVVNVIYKGWIVLWIASACFAGIVHKSSMVIPIILGGLVGTFILADIWRDRRVFRLGTLLKRKPTKRRVKEYIRRVKKRRFAPRGPAQWKDLRKIYRQVAECDDIDYDLKLQLCETLKAKGTRGVYHPKKQRNISIKKQEEKIRQAGDEGERQVGYALKWLDKRKFKVFSNIRLLSNNGSQEFDNIVIGNKAVFNIESKNYIGDLTIDKAGNWYRIINGRKSGTENPGFQIRRHRKVLDYILESKMPIVDLIVWVNIESIIEGAENSSIKIIKVDQLEEFIESYDKGRGLSKSEVNFTIKAIERNLKKF